MTLEKAFFILRHGSAEGEHKYFEAISVIENEYNRQKAEIENYIKVAEYQQNLTLKKSFEIKELKAEIERLSVELDLAKAFYKEKEAEFSLLNYRYNKTLNQLDDYQSITKAEAIKEFAERLKEYVESYDVTTGYKITIVNAVEEETIDNLVKEMVGES